MAKASLLSQVHEAVLGLDANSNITYWNKGAEELFGWKSEEVIVFKFEVPFYLPLKKALLKNKEKKEVGWMLTYILRLYFISPKVANAASAENIIMRPPNMLSGVTKIVATAIECTGSPLTSIV